MMNFVASMHTSSIYFEKWQSKREIKKIKMKNPADSSAGFLHINFSSSHAQLHDILYHFDKIDHHSQFYRFLYILLSFASCKLFALQATNNTRPPFVTKSPCFIAVPAWKTITSCSASSPLIISPFYMLLISFRSKYNTDYSFF